MTFVPFSRSGLPICGTRSFGDDDPLFPAPAVVNGKGLKFEVSGLARRHWSNAGPIRAIFRDAFTRPGLTYFNPPRSAKPSHNSESVCAARRKSLKRGHRTWGTRT